MHCNQTTTLAGSETVHGRQIVLTNWQILFNSAPPDESEFNLVFNNHNLIDDDKLSVLSPPRSPEHPSAEDTTRSGGLPIPPATPQTTVTYVDDRDCPSPTRHGSPPDTLSSDEHDPIEILPLAIPPEEVRRASLRSDHRRTPHRRRGSGEPLSNRHPHYKSIASFHSPLVDNISSSHYDRESALHQLTKPQPLLVDKRCKKQQYSKTRRLSGSSDHPRLINYGVI